MFLKMASPVESDVVCSVFVCEVVQDEKSD